MRHWTIAERAKQSNLIKNWKPWQKAGVKTETGKAISCMNAMKHGEFSRKAREERHIVKELIRLSRAYLSDKN